MQNPQPTSEDNPGRRQRKFGVLFKGILIVGLPLIFQMFFFGMLILQIQKLEVEVARETRARRIMQTMSKLTELTYEIAAAAVQLKSQVMNSDKEKLKTFFEVITIGREKIQGRMKELKGLIKGYPDEEKGFEQLDRFYQKSDKMFELITEGLQGGASAIPALQQLTEYRNMRKGLLNELTEGAKDFMHRYEKIERGSPEAQKRLRDSQKGVILFGIAGNFVIAIILVLYFSRSITDRLKVMTLNTMLLAKRQPLMPRISGTDEIAQLDGVFHSMAEALEQASREKQEFLELVSHDIRSPMTAILGNVVLLNMGKLGEISPEAKQRMSSAEDNSRRLITLINDLLDLEKLESGQTDFNKSDVRIEGLLEACLQNAEVLADKVGVSIDLDVSDETLTVSANEARLAQVVENLLSNSIIFAGAKKRILVRAARLGELVEISVIDKSRIVPPELLNYAFERRSSEHTKEIRRFFGKGVALPLSKLIIEAMDGKIGVKAAEGEGTCFWINLAAVQTPMPLVQAAESE
ncbi:MAG: HAMP domain-containing histidine kinase [Candidatus Obscuribacterales bacterium]|jgi:signal transduction histidine kinase|nr:HAMP domain-containing histidine kinase [Candidatus Obscuribacterales bacterium]